MQQRYDRLLLLLSIKYIREKYTNCLWRFLTFWYFRKIWHKARNLHGTICIGVPSEGTRPIVPAWFTPESKWPNL